MIEYIDIYHNNEQRFENLPAWWPWRNCTQLNILATVNNYFEQHKCYSLPKCYRNQY